ncbi:glycosyltransferase family 2 protein [Cytobacillus purgationiresistens]|uniref:Cellulose synthase/poly-beta-1,6-N-acetylglucosamine synthase-like glycosyltransferase n=1 Tax=Cytobacillus purgationiresistens TaxID=863449 RepID=A0ABU0APG6_9BACI|nr:cellulose synthase/poly-beta-1,6-N-acetylglucosamine synthase-like glycosyltransferase [Cytobacillus purgationiresistens]
MLAVAGIIHRRRENRKPPITLQYYPSVALLIPAHNEGLVMKDTLDAMMKLRYPGQLDVYLLDDQSTDETREIGLNYAKTFSRIHYIPVPNGSPKGKSRVLNYGLSISNSDYFVVYDADNEPEPDAVRLLVEAAEQTENAAGAVGYVRTKNQDKNLLTRMISIEFQVFQLLMQSGRWSLFKIGSLPGTNMLLRRSVIEEVGGYDLYALAEDAELTIRITQSDYLLPIIPKAQTWEQEPENLRTFIKQRTRWLIGNIYLLEKTCRSPEFWKGRAFYHSLQHVLTYFLFVLLLAFSNLFFIASLTGFELPIASAPLLMIWFMSYIVYAIQIIGSMVFNKQTAVYNLAVGAIMYFTYAQLFLILLLRAFSSYFYNRIKGSTIAWDKTKRFKGDPS